MNTEQPTGSPDDTEAITRRLQDAVKELRALRARRSAQQRAARQATHLQQLTALSKHRRAPTEGGEDA